MGYMSETYRNLKDWNKEKNDLTWELLKAGYTPENHPEHVRWVDHSYVFEYTLNFLRNTVWESPCGLLKTGLNSHHEMGFMGIDWMPENNNPVFRCPHDKDDCELNHELLKNRKMYGHLVECAFHFSNKEYDYDNSVDKLWEEREARQEQLYQEFKEKLKGRICRAHTRFDEISKKWTMKYNLEICARNECYTKHCPITGQPNSEKKGNVFYDLKITRIRHEGSLWDGERIVGITKGIKAFSSPISLTICEAYAKHNQKDLLEREKMKMHGELMFNPDIEVEILNTRVERRETRDLLQDLQDVAEGIQVSHASDNIKKAAQAKRDRKAKRMKGKISKWQKWLGGDSERLKQIAERKLAAAGVHPDDPVNEPPKPVEQLSLFN